MGDEDSDARAAARSNSWPHLPGRQPEAEPGRDDNSTAPQPGARRPAATFWLVTPRRRGGWRWLAGSVTGLGLALLAAGGLLVAVSLAEGDGGGAGAPAAALEALIRRDERVHYELHLTLGRLLSPPLCLWGTETPSSRRMGAAGYARRMLLSLVYAVVCALLDLLLARTPAGRAQVVELLAVRHEVRVLRRQAKRTRWWAADRLLLAALSRCAPRTEWWRFPVRPETLLRWHRELVRRKWCRAREVRPAQAARE
jgi:hypothetical protein